MAKKIFSIAELRKWLYETANEAMKEEAWESGTVYWYMVGEGLAVVLCFEEGYEVEENNPYQHATGKFHPNVSGEWQEAYNIVVSLRIAHSSMFADDWEYAVEEDCGCSLHLNDCLERMKKVAHYLSKERTQVIKSNKNK